MITWIGGAGQTLLRSGAFLWQAGAVLILGLAPMVATAWEFRSTPVCTLLHDTGPVQIAVTFDPELDEPYAIGLTLPVGVWPEAPDFMLRFDGLRPLVIGTDRHVRSDGGRTLTVTDRGFDNVLSGLADNRTAFALSGNRIESFDLAGIAGPMAAFLDCPGAELS